MNKEEIRQVLAKGKSFSEVFKLAQELKLRVDVREDILNKCLTERKTQLLKGVTKHSVSFSSVTLPQTTPFNTMLIPINVVDISGKELVITDTEIIMR